MLQKSRRRRLSFCLCVHLRFFGVPQHDLVKKDALRAARAQKTISMQEAILISAAREHCYYDVHVNDKTRIRFWTLTWRSMHSALGHKVPQISLSLFRFRTNSRTESTFHLNPVAGEISFLFVWRNSASTTTVVRLCVCVFRIAVLSLELRLMSRQIGGQKRLFFR